VAAKLGVREEFTMGKTYEDWARDIVDRTRELEPDFPTYEEFSKKGIYKKYVKEPLIAFTSSPEMSMSIPS
jgi:anaerobic dimethyl sulfoxide reductase subunit A